MIEALEPRLVLAADLIYPVGASDLKLTYSSESLMFQLLDPAKSDSVVSEAFASAATSGGIRVTGTSDADVLRLDWASLTQAGSQFSIAFNGVGSDTVTVEADTDFNLAGSTLSVGTTIFTLSGFERAELTGGDSSNAFTFGAAVTIGSLTVEGGADTDFLFGSDGNNSWMLTGKGTGTVGAVTFTGIENLVGGTGDDTYSFANEKLGDVFLDETAGGTDKLDFSLRGAAVTIDLSSTDKQTVDESLISGFTLTLGSGIAIENVVGSTFADTITGNMLENRITGGGGGDTLAGGAADDTYVFTNGWGSDTIAEEPGLENAAGEDTVDFSGVTAALTFAVLADGTLRVSDGQGNVLAANNIDVLLGGTSVNTLDYSLHTEGVSVDLSIETADLFSAVRNVVNVVGTVFADQLIGDENANRLEGGVGDDIISGDEGNDVLLGGTGVDRLLETRDADITLTDTSVTFATAGMSSVESDQISGFERAEITGGAHANRLDASSFTGSGGVILDGGSLTLLSVLNGGIGVRTNVATLADLAGKESQTLLAVLNNGDGIRATASGTADFQVNLADGSSFEVDIQSGMTVEQMLTAIVSAAPAGRVTASLSRSGSCLFLTDENPPESASGVMTVTALNNSLTAFDLGILGTGGVKSLEGTAITDVSSDLVVILSDGRRIDIDLAEASTIEEVLILLNLADDLLFADINANGTGINLLDTAGGVGNLEVRARNGSTAASDMGLLRVGIGSTLTGEAIIDGNVRLDGRLDHDVLIGSPGDDMLRGGGGNDVLSGGLGIDTVVETRDANFVLLTASLTIGSEVDTLTSIEKAVLTGGFGNNTIDASGFAGPVLLFGQSGDDTLIGGNLDDIFTGGDGKDTIQGNGGRDTVVEEADVNFILVGGPDSATLDMAEGNNEVVTVSLTGTVTGGSFKLTFDGQTTEAIPFDAGAPRVKSALTALSNLGDNDVRVEQATASDPWRITFVGARKGSNQADVTALGNGLIGGGSILTAVSQGANPADWLNQIAGIELVRLTGGWSDNILDASGFTGDVELYGEDGNDTLLGGSGADKLYGGLGNDTLTGNGSADELNANEGFDTLKEFRDWDFTLTNSSLTISGGGLRTEVDTVLGFERTVLTGGASNNRIDTFSFSGLSDETLLSLLNASRGVRTTNGSSANLSGLEASTQLSVLNQGRGIGFVSGDDLRIHLSDGATTDVDVYADMTLENLLDAITKAGNGKLAARISPTGSSIVLTDSALGTLPLQVTALNASTAAGDLGILGTAAGSTLTGIPLADDASDLRFTLTDGKSVGVDLTGLTTLDDVFQVIHSADARLTATLNATGTAIVVTDTAGGPRRLSAMSVNGSYAAEDLGIAAVGSGDMATILGSAIGVSIAILDGGAGDDTLIAGAGNDTLTGGLGSDSISGGGGLDTIVESRNSDAVLTSTQLKFGTAGTNFSPTETDTLNSIDRATLIGGTSKNSIDASGFSGPVTFYSGGGLDTLKGGSGNDLFFLDVGNRSEPISANQTADQIAVTAGGGADEVVILYGSSTLSENSFNWVNFQGDSTGVSYTIKQGAPITIPIGTQIVTSGRTVTLQSDTINVQGKIDTSGSTAGDILLLGRHITIDSGAQLIARSTGSDRTQDGTIHILAVDDSTVFKDGHGLNLFDGMVGRSVVGSSLLDATTTGLDNVAQAGEGGFFGFYNRDLSAVDISINNATIRGGDVVIISGADTTHPMTASDFGGPPTSIASKFSQQLSNVVTSMLNTSLFAGVSRAEATAWIEIGTKPGEPTTVIDANNFTAWSKAQARASSAPAAVVLPIAVAVGIVKTDSRVVLDNVTITTSADATVRSSVDSAVDVVANSGMSRAYSHGGAKPGAQQTGSQKAKSIANTGSLAVAVSVLDSNSVAEVTKAATLTVGEDLFVQSDSVDRNNTSAGSTTKPNQGGTFAGRALAMGLGSAGIKGTGIPSVDKQQRALENKSAYGVAVAVSVESGATYARLDGTAEVKGSVQVNATQMNGNVTGKNFTTLLTSASGVSAATNVGSNVSNFAQSLQKSLVEYQDNKARGGKKAEGTASFQGGFAVAVMDDTNLVEARIGDGVSRTTQPYLRAFGTITVTAEALARPDITASSKLFGRKTDLVVDEKKVGDFKWSDPQAWKEPPVKRQDKQVETGVGVAVAIGNYSNTANAVISSYAVVDAGKEILVQGRAKNQIDPNELWGANLYNALSAEKRSADYDTASGQKTLKTGQTVLVKNGHSAGGEVGQTYVYQGPDNTPVNLGNEDFNGVNWQTTNLTLDAGLNFIRTYGGYADGNFGLDNNLIDALSQVYADGFKKTAIALAVTVLNVDQNSSGLIRSQARINKNVNWQSALIAANDQAVKVLAESINDAINVGGSKMGNGVPKFREKQEQFNAATKGKLAEKLIDVNPWKAYPIQDDNQSGAARAVGASVQVFGYSTNAQARIEADVDLLADSLIVDAQSHLLAVNLGVGKASGGSGGLGTGVYTSIDDVTIASIDGNARVDVGGDASVRATDTSTLITVAGAIMEAEKVGFGGSGALNDVRRNTQASIGLPTSGSAQSPATGHFTSTGGNLTVAAENAGFLGTFSVAGAMTKKLEEKSAQKEKTITGFSAAVGYSQNWLSDVTKASIHDALVQAKGDITITARATTVVEAFAAALSTASGSKNSIGLAGAGAVNDVDNDTQAFIEAANTVKTDGGVNMAADDGTSLYAQAGAIAYTSTAKDSGSSTDTVEQASSSSAASGSVGVSVALNRIGQKVNIVKAFVRQADILTTNDVQIVARTSGDVHSLALSGSVATASSGEGKLTGGTNLAGAASGAYAASEIATEIQAAILEQSDVRSTEGNVALTAVDRQGDSGSRFIRSDAFGAAVAYAAAKRPGGNAGALSIGVGIAHNSINDSVATLISESDVNAKLGVALAAQEKAYVSALGIGVSVSVAKSDENAGGTGWTAAVAGAGSAAVNELDNSITSSISVGSTVTSSTGAVKVDALDDIEVVGVAGTVAVAVGLKSEQTKSGGATAAIAVGAAVVRTDIGGDGGHFVKSSIADSDVSSGTSDITVAAESTASLYTLAAGGSGSYANGGRSSGTTGSFAGAGVGVDNSIVQTISAAITGGSRITALEGDVVVKAIDSSAVTADAGAVAVALASGQGTGSGVSGSVGVAIALNSIQTDVLAKLQESKVEAESIDVLARSIKDPASSSDYRIDALAFGVAGSGAKSSAQGLAGAFAGAGSGARNRIDNSITASVINSNGAHGLLAGQGGVTIAASDDSSIRADSGGLAIAVGLSKGNAGAGGVGVSVSLNEIGTQRGHSVAASIDNSRIVSQGSVSLTAVSTAKIDALAMAGAVAAANSSGNSLSGALAGAGVGSINTISMDIKAEVLNKSSITVVGGMIIKAEDSSAIDTKALAGTISLSNSSGGGSGSLAIGISIAKNEIDNAVRAAIDDSTATATSGNLEVLAKSHARIEAVAVAASVSVASAKTSSVSIGGGGAAAFNTISGSTDAEITAESTVTTTDGGVFLQAFGEANISATIAAVALGIGVSSSGSAGAAAIGASVARNRIGYDDDDDKSTSRIRARANNSKVNSAESFTVAATANPSIDATVVSASVAVSAGKNAVGLSGAGSQTTNQIATTVEGSIDGIGPDYGISARSISVTATDSSRIVATAGAAAVAAAVSKTGPGVALSIAVGLAENIIDNDVIAAIKNSDSVTSTGSITVDARTLGRTMLAPDFTSASGSLTLSVGQKVKLADDYANGGQGGRTYAYRGFVADYDITSVNFTNSETNANVFQGDLVRVSGGAIYSYIGNDNSNQGIQLNLSNQNYSDTANWELATVTLNTGNTVKTNSDTYYRYLGNDGTLSLGQESYTDTSRWQLILPNTIDLGNTDYSNTKLWEISDGSITTTAVAASFAAAFGKTAGVSVSGAGAYSRNRILSKTNAFVDNSTITATGNLEIQSLNTSMIDAKVVAASVAIGASGKVGVGASIGAAIAENLIGRADSSITSPTTEVKAYASDSGMILSGGLDIHANDAAQINALVFAGSVAVAIGGQVGVGASGAGVSGINKISTDVQAYIDGDNRANATSEESGIQATSVAIQATDSTRIDALAGAVSVAAAFGKIGVAISVGASLATNAIDINTFAYISDVDSKFDTNQGAILVEAQSNSEIQSTTFAASVAIGGGGTIGVAVSGAVATATNSIGSKTNAYIENSVLGATSDKVGKVDVLASSSSLIDAVVAVGSAAVGFGLSGAGVGVAVGVATARNFLGYAPTGGTVTGFVVDATGTPVSTLTQGMKVRIVEGSLAGEVYEYIGTTTSDSDPNTAGNQLFDLKQQQFRDSSLWKHINAATTGAEIKAYVRNASIHSIGSLNVHADSAQGITSEVIGVSVGVGASSNVGVGASGAGTYAENWTMTDILANIDGDGSIATAGGITANGISVVATDSTKIDSKAVAASLAAGIGFGSGGLGISIGISLASNSIENNVTASITDYGSVHSTNGIVVDAKTLSGAAPASTYSSSSGTQTLVRGDTVSLSSSYANGGLADRQYRYRGFTADYDIANISLTNVLTSAKVYQGDLVRVSGNKIYSYVGSDNNHSGANLNLATENYLDETRWKLATVLLRAGNTVQASSSNAYRYLGADETFCL
ncbi:MAG: LEPR-XLL domain-containing protein, partial [Planctomycetota bacterium]|nr:LEPR-XLL domain-containing protein [Planctomycetota bacterium]